jgi:hypothetical protein
MLGFGGAAEDPDGVGALGDNPLSNATNTTGRVLRLPDHDPRSQGQYGISLKYYADELNGGTEFGMYFENYHSKLPYVSFYSTNASCERREGNALHIDVTNQIQFLLACPDIPLLHVPRGDPAGATSSVYPFDTAKIQLEYPEDIHLIGASFNTTVAGVALQGEVAFRPNLPLQVETTDLAFAAFGPTGNRCFEKSLQCIGSIGGVGTNANGALTLYPSSNFVNAAGINPYPDAISLAIADSPGSARLCPGRHGQSFRRGPGDLRCGDRGYVRPGSAGPRCPANPRAGDFSSRQRRRRRVRGERLAPGLFQHSGLQLWP